MSDKIVKIKEIIRRDRPRTMHQLIPPPSSMGTHTRVGQLPPVNTQYAGRIYLILSGAPRLFRQTTHHPLGGRGTADVTEADKKNFFLHQAIHPLRKTRARMYEKSPKEPNRLFMPRYRHGHFPPKKRRAFSLRIPPHRLTIMSMFRIVLALTQQR